MDHKKKKSMDLKKTTQITSAETQRREEGAGALTFTGRGDVEPQAVGPESSRMEHVSNRRNVNFTVCCPEALLHKGRDMTIGFDSTEFATHPSMQFQRRSRDGSS